MSWMASGVRSAMTITAVAVALIGTAATGATAPANAAPGFAGMWGPAPLDDAPTGPDDPKCIQMPLSPVCKGGPYAPSTDAANTNPASTNTGVPTSPSDPACATMPTVGVCASGPYALQSEPPAAGDTSTPAASMPSMPSAPITDDMHM